MSTLDKLRALGACDEALEWVASRPKKRQTLAALWADCPRGDWMLWLAARLGTPDADGIQSAAWACTHLAQAYATANAYAYAAAAAYAAVAANAAHAAAYAYAYADANADADASDARGKARRECADLVRLLVRRPR